MVLPIGQGTKYGADVKTAHVINVDLTRYDFMNAVSLIGNPSDLAHPDAYDEDAVNNTPVTLTQRGYLGYKAVFDIGAAMRSQGMAFIQSVFIDNSEGLGVLILRSNSGQTITVAPCTQGVYPLLVPQGASTSFECAYIDPNADDVSSVPSFGDYPDLAPDFSGAGGVYGIPQPVNDATVRSGRLRFQFADVVMPIGQWQCRNLVTARWVDFSGLIVGGGIYQTAISSNPFRKGFIIANPNTAVEPLYIDLHQVLSGGAIMYSVTLYPGEHYKEVLPEPSHVERVSVMAATAGHTFMAKAKF
jgi:hypothetical protein